MPITTDEEEIAEAFPMLTPAEVGRIAHSLNQAEFDRMIERALARVSAHREEKEEDGDGNANR